MKQKHTRIIHEALGEIPNYTLKIQVEIQPWFKPIFNQLLKCAIPTRSGKLIKLHDNSFITIDHDDNKILWLSKQELPIWVIPIKRG